LLSKIDYMAEKTDLDIVMERDPAPKTRAEAMLFSPGLHAIRLYRISHRMYERKNFFFARMVNFFARMWTGADIHPGAKIGKGFFIDHASGVVIGETSEIGDNVSIFQGVTLGGVSMSRGKRHPTLGNNVTVGAGAAILGAINIGDNVKVGAGSVVVKDVPPNSTVVGIPAKIVQREGAPSIDLAHDDLPDPIMKVFIDFCHSVSMLEYRISQIEDKVGIKKEEKKGESCPKLPE